MDKLSIGAVAKMVNAPDWKSGYGGSSPPFPTKYLNIAYGDARCVRRPVTAFNQVGSIPI